MNLSGKKIIITGAAGRIGLETAKSCLKYGAKVVLADINKNILNSIKNDSLLNSFSGEFYTYEVDLTKNSNLENLISYSDKVLGGINGAVHCAYPVSKNWGATIENLKEEDLYFDLNMQLGGAIFFSKYIIKYFIDHGGGNLIHISSIQGLGAPKFEHYYQTSMNSPIEYTAIKAGIIAITKWLAKYNKNNNVRVNCVSPGGILDNQPEQFIKRYRESCINFGMLEPSQVTEAIIFLLSSNSEAINGQNLIIDDGWSI
jgi:NAD(P)-dependent dehydrogenase (short-subunit alcohol dehydrogenase family)